MMDATRWKLIERLYEEVRELSEAQRKAYLTSHPDTDAELIAEVNVLLDQQEKAAGFFEEFREDIFSKVEEPEEKTPAQATDSLVGRKIAQYKVEEKIGDGGMGAVYKALDTKLDRYVALKILHASLSSSEEAKERFIIEAKAASLLSHPNVATVYAIEDLPDERMAIAMMYCEGTTLKERLKQGLPEIDIAVDIAIQIAKGLLAAHQRGVIHRDIKPGNIMLGERDEVRIVDFGLARVAGQSRITRTGSTMGTVAYMAPEQAKGAQTGHQADIWSFGVVLFEMLTGQVPFYGEHIHSMLYAVINEQPVPIAGLRPGIPSQLSYIVTRAISKDLFHRYNNFEEIINDLETAQKGKDIEKKVDEHSTDSGALDVLSQQREQEEGAIKILVVDDEPDVELLLRQQYMKKIRAEEWQLVFAENGVDALEKLEADPEIQLVMTDIQMPVMNGLTLLSRIDEMDRLIRTIVVSAYGDMQNIRKAMNAGAFDFVTKPIQFPDLERTIYKTIDQIRSQKLADDNQHRLLSLENELDLARQVQQSVLPKQLPESDELSIYAYMEPAREVNGDFYDFFYLDDEQLGFFIGDVSGKGFSAAIFMAMCRTLLKADAKRGFDPAACIDALNQFVYPEQVDGIFITAFYGVLSIKTGLLTYCNAGHNPPFLLRETGEIEQLPWTGGIGIGVKKNFEYENATAQLGKSDGLFLYTDGLTKSKNKDRDLFSDVLLREVLQAHVDAMPSQLIRQVVREVAGFTTGVEQLDDNTLLAIRRTVA